MVDKAEQFKVSVNLQGRTVTALLDTGATRNFVSTRLARKLKTFLRQKENPYPLRMADNTPVDYNGGWVTEELDGVKLSVDKRTERLTLDVVKTEHDVVLGMPWLVAANPWIDWTTRQLHAVGDDDQYLEYWEEAKEDVEIPREYQEFEDLFKEREGLAALPEHRPWDHEIPIMEGKIPTHYGGLIPHSRKEEDYLKEYIGDLLKKGFIRPSESSISHGVLFAPKKDGGLRPCIDFRKLNEITKKNRYPLPRIDELQDRLLGAKYFTLIDVRDAYYRVRMKEGEEWKTAFRTRWGLFEYTVMPFGLTNAPATFQALINDTLREYLDDFAMAYLDDVLIFSRTMEEHKEHVRKVLTKLQERDLPVKLSKCEFHKETVKFLGFQISENQIAPDPDKVKAIKEWPKPTNLKEVQSFVGTLNFYRRLVKGFSKVAAPLTNLTKKDTAFRMNQACEEAFEKLKELITSEPILQIFDPEKESVLETDASDEALGAQLSQMGPSGRLHPVAFFSRKMTEAEKNYDIHDKELLAIVEALRQWRVYLEGPKYPVQIYSDHKNLLYWTTTKQLNRRQVRWAETLASYNFVIKHVRGKENARADALSRRPDLITHEKQEGALLRRKNHDWTVPIQDFEGYCRYNTPEIQEARELMKKGDKTITESSDGRLYQNGVLMEPRDDCDYLFSMGEELTKQEKRRIIHMYHDRRTAGHPGITRTLELIKRNHGWRGMKKDVKDHIRACDTCAKAKHSRLRKYGLLQPLEVPSRPWASITMDFITKLPLSEELVTRKKYDAILVVVERLTKYAHFIPYCESSGAEDLAYVFLRYIFSQHGMPEEIISDRDKLFTSKFWKSLMEQLGTKHRLSTAYHPQTDGQTERTNQTLEQYLRCYTNYQQDDWVSLLPVAEFAYNNTAPANGISPFVANYGYHPGDGNEPIAEKYGVAPEALRVSGELREIQEYLREELERTRQRMRRQQDPKRTEGPALKEGEMVYLIRKNIRTRRPNDKLDHKKLGPFGIKRVHGPVTFELDLPKTMKIHPVFHKSLLEPCYNPNAMPGPIEIDRETQEPEWEVEAVLDCQPIGGKPHYLVKWSGWDAAHNTWEPLEHLTHAQSLVDCYHQGGSRGRPRRSRRRT